MTEAWSYGPCVSKIRVLMYRGVHSAKAMMHFPLFQISPCFQKNVTISENFSNFRPTPKNLGFLVIASECWIPLFSLKCPISPLFLKIFSLPYFHKFLSDFVYMFTFFTYFTRFSFPPTFTVTVMNLYASQKARTGRAFCTVRWW